MKKTTVFKTAILAFALIICSFSLSAQATLPFSYDGTATSLPTGLTGSGLSSYAATPFIKFAATGNFLILNFAATSGALTFNLKWNPSSVVARFPGTFTLQESVDGVSYTNVQVFDATNGPVLANTVITPITINTLQTTTRYLKWIYTAKSNGNIALGAIVLNAGSTPNVLTLSTQAATSVISTSATLNGTISAFDASSAFVNSYGFCWNTTGTPTIADTKVDKGFSSTIGAYSHSISINPSTTYYARAYATNASGVTSYGSQVSFTTTSGFAAVSTQAATTIASTTATLNGTISSLGDTPVTAHGFCWNTTGTPTTDNSKTDLGVRNATGLMTSNISSLLPSTTYYVRSFATNNVGTFYGNEISFTTKPLGVNEINVTTPGTLSILASSFLSTVTNLTLTGSIDARDFKTMRDNMPLLVNLDMSGVNIVSYLGLEGTSEKSTNYKADAIPAWAFYFTATNTGKVSLKSILLPMTLTTIEASAFDGCTGITSIIFPTNVTTIEEGAFFGCVGLKILELPAMLTSISNDVFIKCTGLTSVNIPSTVNSIGNSAFSNCSSLSSVTIPTSVTSIGSGAFEGCIGLTSFNIPASVISIGSGALYYCSNLTSIYAYSTTPINLSNSILVFTGINKSSCKLIVPIGSKAAYQAADQWKDFVDVIDIITLVWTQKNSFQGTPMREALSFSIASKGYIGNTTSQEFWEFTPSTNQWTKKANMPNVGFQSPSFVLNGLGYVISGNKVWVYNPQTNIWTSKNNIPGNDKRAGFGMSINGKGYVGGGFYNLTDFWEYDSNTDSWTQKGALPQFTSYIGVVSFVVNNKGYVTGTNNGFWQYDPTIDTWTQKAYVSAGYGQALAIGSSGYLFNTVGELWRYDVVANSWSLQTAYTGRKMCYPCGFSIDNSGYIGVGGLFENNTCTLNEISDFWEFSEKIIGNSQIVINSSPIDGGVTTGAGTYQNGTSKTVTATPNTGYTFTNWTENGTVVSTSANYTFSVIGNKTLIANFSTITDLKLNQIQKTSLQLYPNPAKIYIRISTHEVLQRLVVCDISGRLIQYETVNSNTYSLNVSHLAKGVYLIKGFTEKGIVTNRFIKE